MLSYKTLRATMLLAIIAIFAFTASAAGPTAPRELSGKNYCRIDLPGMTGETLTFHADGTYTRVSTTGYSNSEEAGLAVFAAGTVGNAGSGPTVALGKNQFGWTASDDGMLLLLWDVNRLMIYSADPEAETYACEYAASSALSETVKGVKLVYPPENLGGGDITKFWAEGEKGSGVDSWVELSLHSRWSGDVIDGLAPAYVVIANGFPGNATMYAANTRVSKVQADFDGAIATWSLADTPRPQIFAFLGEYGVERVRFTFKDIYQGTKFEDLCVNKILVIASSGAANPAKAAKAGLIDLITVAGGTFKMGGTGDYDRPIHTVTVSGFRMSRTEVTQAQYLAIMEMGPSFFNIGVDAPQRPVETVSWHDALAFCNQLSAKEGLSPAYTIKGDTVALDPKATGYRLPTEAEWEYAARGGAKPDGTTYAGSNDINTVAWYNSISKTPQPVGTKAPNGLGLYDMSGNVWEWCWDWYADYGSAAQTNPMGAASGTKRVIRGGDWIYGASDCTVAGRYYENPDGWGITLGFRVVRP